MSKMYNSYYKLNLILVSFQALIDIAALWISAAATSYLFSRVNKTAGLLLLPYLAWLTLASALTYTIYRDNKPEIKAADAKAD